jgi:hypothetical protein
VAALNLAGLVRKGKLMMIPRILYKSIGAAILVLVVPGLLAAISVSKCNCQAGPPTPESYTWNFPREATSLLQQVQERAAKARTLVAQLQAFDREQGENDWHLDGDVLTRLKAQVDPMDQMICKLRTISRVCLPWQQKAIHRIAPAVVELTDCTRFELNYLNKDKQWLWNPTYTAETTDMYNEANRIVNSIGSFTEYAKARSEIRELSPKLGMSAKAAA